MSKKEAFIKNAEKAVDEIHQEVKNQELGSSAAVILAGFDLTGKKKRGVGDENIMLSASGTKAAVVILLKSMLRNDQLQELLHIAAKEVMIENMLDGFEKDIDGSDEDEISLEDLLNELKN